MPLDILSELCSYSAEGCVACGDSSGVDSHFSDIPSVGGSGLKRWKSVWAIEDNLRPATWRDSDSNRTPFLHTWLTSDIM